MAKILSAKSAAELTAVIKALGVKPTEKEADSLLNELQARPETITEEVIANGLKKIRKKTDHFCTITDSFTGTRRITQALAWLLLLTDERNMIWTTIKAASCRMRNCLG